MQESGLPRGRLEGERGRTMNQLKLFAAVVREGSWLEARIDPAMPDRKPLPRSDLRMRNVPVGPVAVFGASNFPLAFSVAGGDTASALAAGCPVIVKAHHAHPGTSELVGRAVQAAVKECGLPEGVFSLLFGPGSSIGAGLVADPRIKAVGFTGSRGGGTALMRIANNRAGADSRLRGDEQHQPGAGPARTRSPIAARRSPRRSSLRSRWAPGQFCTNPGLLLGAEGAALDGFVGKVAENLGSVAGADDAHARHPRRLSRRRREARGEREA